MKKEALTEEEQEEMTIERLIEEEQKETRGRKYSGGRVRTKTLSAKFTEKEKADILAIVKESGLTQSDFLIKATDYYEINTTKNREVK